MRCPGLGWREEGLEVGAVVDSESVLNPMTCQ